MSTPCRLAYVLLVLSLAASGCDGGSSTDGDPDGGGGGGDGGGGGAGCGDAPSIALGAWVEQSVSVSGEGARPYFVRLPNGYDPDTPYPVVYQLHGCSSDADREANNVPVENASGDEAIHVRGRAADNCWDNTTDVPYFDAMVAEIEATYCTDPDRRLLAGYSSGAFFAHRLGCIRGDLIRGIATIAGGSPGNACTGQVAVLQIHDVNDGTVVISPGAYNTRDFWREANGCEMSSSPTDDPPCVEYAGCDAAHPVVWCETTGMGHNRQDGFAAPLFWSFLSSL